MTERNAYLVGRMIAALIFIPLTGWAKLEANGMFFLILAVLFFIGCAILIRIYTGQWP